MIPVPVFHDGSKTIFITAPERWIFKLSNSFNNFMISDYIPEMRTKSSHYYLESYLILHLHQTFFFHDCKTKHKTSIQEKIIYYKRYCKTWMIPYLVASTSQCDIGIPLVMLVTWTFKSDILSLSFHTYFRIDEKVALLVSLIELYHLKYIKKYDCKISFWGKCEFMSWIFRFYFTDWVSGVVLSLPTVHGQCDNVCTRSKENSLDYIVTLWLVVYCSV